MTTFTRSARPALATTRTPSVPTTALVSRLQRFKAEVSVFLSAILNPRHILGEVERMRVLYREAARVEAHDADRAARLREQASRIGLG